METPSPLDVPEILTLVMSFVPVWDISPFVKFNPRHLLSCALVSMFWRQTALPHLWAMYISTHMGKVPVDLLFSNSHHIRNFILHSHSSLNYMFRVLWQKDSSGQLRLRCTALKSFSLMSECLPEQVELIRANRGIVSLDMPFTSSMSRLPVITQDLVASLAESLKTLRLFDDLATARELVSFLNNFSSLEHLQMGGKWRPFNMHTFDELEGSTGVRIQTLKRLTISDFDQAMTHIGSLLSIFRNCPIDHLVLHMHRATGSHFQSALQPLTWAHEAALSWRSRQQEETSRLLQAESTCAADAKMRISDSLLPQSTYTGVDRLDIHVADQLSAQFQNDCRDLVSLRTTMDRQGPYVIVPLVESSKDTLRDVDLTCGPTLDGYNTFEILSRLVGSLSELRRLRFVAEYGLNKEDSVATFQGWFFQDDQEGGLTASSPALKTTRTRRWACQHLESLTVRGLWGATSKDQPNVGQDTVILKAASEEHHWVACGTTYFGKQFRTTISNRIQTLPELRQLTLGSVAFEYSNVHSKTA